MDCSGSPHNALHSSSLIEYLNMTHVGERMKLLNCISQDMEALAKILASAPRVVSKYQVNVPDQRGWTRS